MEPAEGRANADERALFAPTDVGAGDMVVVRPSPIPQAAEARPATPAARWRLPIPWIAATGVPPQWPRSIARAIETERERGTPFLLVPVLLACGALVYFALPAEPSRPALTAATAFSAAAVALAGDRAWLRLCLSALLFVLLGMAFAKWETGRAGTLMLGEPISTVITGRVMSLEQQPGGRTRMTLELLTTERPKLRHMPERVRLSARKLPAELSAGDTLHGPARLFPPSGPLRPGSYDFSFESYFDGIGANGFFLGSPERVAAPLDAALRDRFWALVENARVALSDRIRARIGGAEGEIAAALIAGTRAGIPDDVNEALRRTGLAHVLSISGLHMALVAATVMGSLRFGFALFPGFTSRRPVKKYAACAALLAIAVYLFISGSAVAAERSFLMLAIMLVALLFDRAAITMRNLAIAAIAVLVVSPHEVVGPSFQMSFAATAALIAAYAWWAERRRRRPAHPPTDRSRLGHILRTGGRYAFGLAITSLIAGIATTVYGAWHFQRVSPLSLAANLAAMPIVSIAVMPPAVLAMAAMPFGLDGPFLDVMGKGLTLMTAVAEWFSARTPVDTVGEVPLSAVVLATVALIVATLATTWLRTLALPFAVSAGFLIATHSLPDVLVAEDGRLVAVPTADGRLAVNRKRPNSFAVEDWMRAMRADGTFAPVTAAGSGKEATGGTSLLLSVAGVLPAETGDTAGNLFRCDEQLCVARTRSGAIVVTTADTQKAQALCGRVQLIVLADAAAPIACGSDATTVVTQRLLALRGSLAFRAGPDGEGSWRTTIAHAVDLPLRPWHEHRRFSRAARGLPPWEPRSKSDSVREQTANEKAGKDPGQPLNSGG